VDRLERLPVRSKDPDIEAKERFLIRERPDPAGIDLPGAGREKDLAPIEPHRKNDAAPVTLTPRAGGMHRRVQREGRSETSDRIGKIAPVYGRRSARFREKHLSEDIAIGRTERDGIVVKTVGGHTENRTRRRGEIGRIRRKIHSPPGILPGSERHAPDPGRGRWEIGTFLSPGPA